MYRFLDDDDSVINSGNDLWLTTVAGSCGEDEYQQSTGSMFQFCVYRGSRKFSDQFSIDTRFQGISVSCN
jgi:hypothetical protein